MRSKLKTDLAMCYAEKFSIDRLNQIRDWARTAEKALTSEANNAELKFAHTDWDSDLLAVQDFAHDARLFGALASSIALILGE